LDEAERFWLKALVHRVDSHVYWTAVARSKKGTSRTRNLEVFEGLVSELYIFLDLVRRTVVDEVELREMDKGFVIQKPWQEIRRLARAPYVFGADTRLYRQDEPPPHFWYEIQVDSFVGETVVCDIAWQGYKDRLQNLRLSKRCSTKSRTLSRPGFVSGSIGRLWMNLRGPFSPR
jgi:hypothetical protein